MGYHFEGCGGRHDELRTDDSADLTVWIWWPEGFRDECLIGSFGNEDHARSVDVALENVSCLKNA